MPGHMSKKNSRLRILSALSILNSEKFFALFLCRRIKFAHKEAQMTQLNGALCTEKTLATHIAPTEFYIKWLIFSRIMKTN